MTLPAEEGLKNRPLCFVLTPLGKKANLAGALVDFDAVYRNLIAPAVEGAGLEPLRAGEDFTEDFNLKPLFEWLTLCPFAVADLTLANASLYYELGARQAQRPGTTVLLCSDHQGTPLGAGALRAIPYSLAADGTPADVAAAKQALARGLEEAQGALKGVRLRIGRFMIWWRNSRELPTPKPTYSASVFAIPQIRNRSLLLLVR